MEIACFAKKLFNGGFKQLMVLKKISNFFEIIEASFLYFELQGKRIWSSLVN